MGHFELNQSKYAVANFKEILNEKLILSKHKYQDENYVTKDWFCSINIGEWEE